MEPPIQQSTKHGSVERPRLCGCHHANRGGEAKGGEASKKMGNCVNKKKIFNPGAVLDRVIAGSGPEDECLLYKLANFKKGVK